MGEDLSVFVTWLLANRGKVVGTGLGILGGLFTLKYGLFKALFLVFCLGFGYLIGARVDQAGGSRSFFEDVSTSLRRRK